MVPAMRLVVVLLGLALAYQVSRGLWRHGSRVVRTAPELCARLVADEDARVRHAFGDDVAIVELVDATIPPDDLTFVAWPALFRTDRNAQSLGGETTPIQAWVRTATQLRMFTFPAPIILRSANAFADAETMAQDGKTTWIVAPGDAVVRPIEATVGVQAAAMPAAFGRPAARPGWELAAENARCQLWRYRKP